MGLSAKRLQCGSGSRKKLASWCQRSAEAAATSASTATAAARPGRGVQRSRPVLGREKRNTGSRSCACGRSCWTACAFGTTWRPWASKALPKKQCTASGRGDESARRRPACAVGRRTPPLALRAARFRRAPARLGSVAHSAAGFSAGHEEAFVWRSGGAVRAEHGGGGSVANRHHKTLRPGVAAIHKAGGWRDHRSAPASKTSPVACRLHHGRIAIPGQEDPT